MTTGTDPAGLPGPDELLATSVSFAGADREFGDLSVDEVASRATELGEAGNLGHRSRVGAVAAAWRELAGLMRKSGAAKVADLPPDEIAARAERLWIVPPGGSLLP
jgi:hypothetical protein